MNNAVCILCSGTLFPLPLPHNNRALVSDGHVLPIALEKTTCLSCGLVTHANPARSEFVRSTYSEEYSLPSASPAADTKRAKQYADILVRRTGVPGSVLEIGCGSGNLLKELNTRWPETFFWGVDPALPSNLSSNTQIHYTLSFFNSTLAAALQQQFDFIFSINVIEHAESPAEFFSLICKLLAPQGRVIIVCPSASPPNIELLFYDHLYTFTSLALKIIAEAAGLELVESVPQLSDTRDFQLLAFQHKTISPRLQPLPMEDTEYALAHSREQYMRAWARLESDLLQRRAVNTGLAMFGAGQMAAVIRAYAPQLWSLVEFLLVDDPSEAWPLDKPIFGYSDYTESLTEHSVIIATAPAVQASVARRLIADGINTIRFDDIIFN
ncbi:class I SAM-dependent methyltransferase [Pollutimonas sp. H1-120]|uniref:class I SAM-dependent methyltransferase n=1 Tax=Pollutimonas sp. H1-120 TaxID=3148824 RepID=UPI003B526DD9